MITHNGTYLPFATHHGMPIYAATMGGKMVIGWLLSATLQAIVAAFGAEGTEVIRKTNDYLNRIATTDPQRALLLANFINEDPMLVCSLVETSKTRWLVGDGEAYVDSDVDLSITESPSVYIHFQYIKSTGSYDTIFGGWFSNTRNTGIWVNNKCIHSRWGNHSGTTYSQAPCLVGTEHTIYADMNKFQYDGSTIYSNIGKITYNGKNPIGATYRDAYYEIYGQFNFACLIIKDNDQPLREMYPMQRTDGTCGMLDIISGTFYPNANTEGSFTIALTDKTTS